MLFLPESKTSPFTGAASMYLAEPRRAHRLARLPSQEELASLLLKPGGLKGCGNPDYCDLAIDQAAFLDTQSDLYWTSKPYVDNDFFSESFCDGRVGNYKLEDTDLAYVQCVHDALP